MKKARVCFVWHMHQPYYTDPVSASASMPWVRLHATKAYFDMAFLLERFPGVHATFNFTPSLLLQLQEIGAGKVPRLRVFNKIDQVGDAKAQAERAKALRARFPKCIVMSAVDKDDIAKLHKMVRAFFARRLVKAELFLPWSAQKLRGEVFANCEVLEERADADGTFFRVRGEHKDIDGLRERIGQTQGMR